MYYTVFVHETYVVLFSCGCNPFSPGLYEKKLFGDPVHPPGACTWGEILSRLSLGIFRVLSLKPGIQFHIFVSEQGLPSKSSPFPPLRSHNFRWFCVLRWNVWKCKLMYRFYCFEHGNAWSSLEQGEKLQHFLLNRVAKFTSFVSWTGSGFRWVGRTPLPKFLLSTAPGPTLLYCQFWSISQKDCWNTYHVC